MHKLIFGITSLTFGGAERVLVDIANELSSKFDITIFTLYGNGELEKELSNQVKLIKMIDKSYYELNKLQRLKMSLLLLFNKKNVYKKYIDKGYNTEIAFLEGPITRLFSTQNKSVKKIAWIHNDIGKVFGNNLKAKVKRKLDKKIYKEYNELVFVSKDNKDAFEKIYKITTKKNVISNFISETRVLNKANEEVENIFDSNQINFLTVSRLTKQKAIDRLINVHSRLIKEGYVHNFFVIGDGPEKNKLKKLVKKNNVEKTFKMLGKKENPYPYMKKCDIFALLSLYEGLPITILEAKIFDKPILVTNTASREALCNYSKSYIVDNSEQGVFDGIKKLINEYENLQKDEEKKINENDNIIEQIEKLVI